MKITNVTSYPLMAEITSLTNAPVSVPRAGSTAKVIFAGYRSLLVRIDTDSGLTGVGEGLVRLAPKATAAIVEDLRPLLLNRDPRDIDVIWEDLFSIMVNRGHNRGFMIEAISAIDIALWDIMAQSQGLPVFRLLGGPHSMEIPCYASSVRIKDPAEAAEDARQLVDDGFRAIKLKIGRGSRRIQEDIDSVAAVREAIGVSVQLMVDANGGYKLSEAAYVARQIEKYDIAWFEEPLPSDDLRGYRQLRSRVNMPLAAGETWFTRYDFREALLHEAVDIVQPDVSRCGGISEARKIAWMASAFHCTYAPHTGQSSAVCLVASLHLAASMSNAATYEFIAADWSSTESNPLRTRITNLDFQSLRQGSVVSPPTGPGLGLSVHWERLEDYQLSN